VGIKFTYFHLSLFYITCLYSFIAFLISCCSFLVMSLLAMVKMLLEINLSAFSLKSSWYRIIIMFPLSDLEIVALFLASLSLFDL
jgi:hypothetical protein